MSGYEVVTQTLDGETGDPIALPSHPNKTIAHHGAGTISVEGSMNGTDWGDVTLIVAGVVSDTGTLAADTFATIAENPLYMRITATDSTTVTIVATGRGN